jgi:hypothetical protein
MSNYVFVRNKTTGEVSVRRANELSRNPHSSLPLQERALHYIGRDRTCICRCSNPKQHYEKIFDIAQESKYLNAGLKLYMDRYDLESCRIEDFRKYRKRKKAEWANEGVEVDDFHYANKEKSLVCRCPKARTHDYGAPRNPEIIEQCAQFFCLHKSKMSVSNHQWKGVDGDTPATYSPDSQPNPFIYDSQSAYGFLNSDPQAQDRSYRPSEMEMRSTAGRVAPVDLNDCRNTMPREPEMPPIVWQNARPAACVPQHDTSSDTSTLMGSASSMPQQTIPAKCPPRNRPIQRDVNVCDKKTPDVPRPKEPIRTKPAVGKASVMEWLGELPAASTYYEAHGTSFAPHEKDDDEPQSQFFELNGNMSVSSRPENHDDVSEKPVAEPPACPNAAELPVERPRQRHTPTLKVLEGRDWDTASELEARRSNIHVQKDPNCRSASITKSVSLSSLFEQVFDVVGSSLPAQKEFLLQHATISPCTNPAVPGNCQFCNEVYVDQRKCIILLAQCGHSLHEHCLLGNFRARDERFGKCPVCDSALCERTLADRIDTDREAIFGSQFTPLQNAVRIEFSQRGKSVNCTSEEEVAVAQLRLLKDYTNAHAEELFRLWEDNRAEPDWFTNVVRPVVMLFQGWNSGVRQSRFFPDRESFLKLIAWAELIRLMDVTRLAVIRSEGKDAMFPRLTELYRKFWLAKDRYDKEKTTWQTDRSGVPDCEKIALDLVKLATDTYPS